MYITYKNNEFFFSAEESAGSVCRLLPPVCIEGGKEIEIGAVELAGESAIYRDGENEVTLFVKKASPTLFYLRRTWKNTADKTRSIRIAQRLMPLFETKRYLIPCVNVNGNEFGAGFEPKGLERD